MQNENIDALLEANRPRLTAEERARVWDKVAKRIAEPEPRPILSPYWNPIMSKSMTPFVIALMIIVGAGGTVAAAESSRPGDVLFPLEQATERVRLAVASEAKADALRTQFASERLAELQAILDEEATASADGSLTLAVTGTAKRAPITDIEIEADVFTDVTVVKLDVENKKTRFTTDAKTEAEVVAEIITRYGLTESEVTGALDFSIEDRASRPSERGGVITSNLGEARVGVAVNAFLDELDELEEDNTNRGRLVSELLREINGVAVAGRGDDDGERGNSAAARIKINDDRMEIRDTGYRVRIDSDEAEDSQGDDEDDDSRDEADAKDDNDDEGDDNSGNDDERDEDDEHGDDDKDHNDDEDDDEVIKVDVRGGVNLNL